MMSCSGVSRFGAKSIKSLVPGFLLVSTSLLAACSADVTRFDNASFSLNDPPETSSVQQDDSRSGSVNNSALARSSPRGPYGAGASSVDTGALPPAAQGPAYASPNYATPSYSAASPSKTYGGYHAKSFAPGRAPSTLGQQAALTPRSAEPAAARGEAVEVRQGDTLYGISRRYHVSVAELMSLNGLQSPSLKLGQKIYLPRDGQVTERAPASGPSAAPTAASYAPAKSYRARSEPAAVAAAPAPADTSGRYDGSYTVKPGDSLYSIARQHHMLYSELQRVNGITDPRKVKPGAVLKVPGGGASSAEASGAASPSAPSDAPDATAAQPARFGDSTTMQPTVINGSKRVASLNTTANDASPVVAPVEQDRPGDKVAVASPTASAGAADGIKLRWPAEGKIIYTFGGRPDGTHNDGINLAVPLGTEVHAAEGGVVVYSGSELKGYGNLILLRHDNGWVTAYAHNDELEVKRGEKVQRGQVIAKAGKTGSVDQPQVHFELRQGSRPVDPIPYLEKR